MLPIRNAAAGSPPSPWGLSAEPGAAGALALDGKGSGPPNVDYLVCVSRAQKTHDLVSILGLIHSTWQSGRLPGGEIRGLRLTWGAAPEPRKKDKKEGLERRSS